jgi:hypothetical protein
VDKVQTRRQAYRLGQHDVFIGDYRTVEELSRKVDLPTLIEYSAGSDEPASRGNVDGPA